MPISQRLCCLQWPGASFPSRLILDNSEHPTPRLLEAALRLHRRHRSSSRSASNVVKPLPSKAASPSGLRKQLLDILPTRTRDQTHTNEDSTLQCMSEHCKPSWNWISLLSMMQLSRSQGLGDRDARLYERHDECMKVFSLSSPHYARAVKIATYNLRQCLSRSATLDICTNDLTGCGGRHAFFLLVSLPQRKPGHGLGSLG